MKKKKKSLCVALAVLLVIMGIYGGMVVWNVSDAGTEEDGQESSMIISNVDSSSISTICYEKDGVSLSFTLSNDKWTYDEDTKFPVLQSALTEMANQLAAVAATRKLENPESLSEYGLDAPQLMVSYGTGDGSFASFLVGDINSTAGGCYLKIEGDDAVYVVSTDFLDAFISDLYEMADMEDFVSLTSDMVTGITISSEDKVLKLNSSSSSSTGWIVTENGSK